MWLFLLSLFAIKSVQSATIGYPYSSIWTYNPIKSGSLHGYLRYLDSNGPGSFVGYNNPQPVYAVRQIKYVNSATPALETLAINNSDETIKARETYLRTASLQEYQNVKSDIDALRAKGKEPSAEKLLKLQMLEKIAFTSDFSLIADLPEIRSTLHDLEASVSSLYKEPVKQRHGEIKTYVGNSNIPLAAIEETPEQKQAREDHLRIYNEQIAHLKHLESEHQRYVQEASSKSYHLQSQNVDKPIVAQTENTKALAELESAQQEHFRLWNEAKLLAQQTGYESGEKEVYEAANKQQISALINDQNIYHPKQIISSFKNTETQKAQADPEKPFEQQGLKNTISTTSTLENTKNRNDEPKLKNEQVQIAHHTSEQQHQVDTPEVVRAREEHLRIVNEAILKAQTVPTQEQQQQQLQQQSLKSDLQADKAKKHSESTAQTQNLKGSSSAFNYRAEQSVAEETPEVKKAREEHLRLVHEANLRAQFVEQQELKYKHESQTPILKSQYEHQQLVYYPETSQNVQETPEVIKAREEHLRLVNEAKLRVYKSEQNEKSIIFPSQSQQQQLSESQVIGDTSEVQRAREEHLRVFNSIKTHAEQEQSKQNSRIFPHPTSQQKPILDYSNEEELALELERLRNAERLQKEQQILELDRMREAERLAEEKHQMEDELLRLRLEEEQRLEMERLLEEKQLQQEQEELEKLKKGEYQEIIIQNDSVGQQPEMAFILRSNVEQSHTQQNSEIVEKQNQQYINNPFLKVGEAVKEPANRLEHSVSQQSSFLTSIPTYISSNTYQDKGPDSTTDNRVSGVHYIHSSHHSIEGKENNIKDDNIKQNYHNAAKSQPADSAVALLALEKATNDHFRAHELALEQLRLARVQNTSLKDCN